MPTPAIIQALKSLLPSLPSSNNPFPPTLISQSESLLALSRQRQPNLKPEEEIARAHACAEIACTRLRAPLRLPAIRTGAGAPCKPTVYLKLIRFLDSSLSGVAAGDIGSVTPSGRKRTADGSVKKSGTPNTPSSKTGQKRSRTQGIDDTPSKKSRTVDRISPVTTDPAYDPNRLSSQHDKHTNVERQDFAGIVRRTAQPSGDDQSQAPEYVMPVVRKLCKKFSTPRVVPHVYTGACILLRRAELWPISTFLNGDSDETGEEEQQELKTQILTLVVALYLMVLTRMRKGPMTNTLYTRVTTESVRILNLRSASSQDREVTEEGEDRGDDAREQIEDWINTVNDEGWSKGEDWWETVPENILFVDEHGQSEGVDYDDHYNGGEADGMNGGINSNDPDDLGQSLLLRQRKKSRTNTDEINQDDPEGVLLPGLGTMLHDAIDWTSEDRRADFDDWKRDIVARIALTESRVGSSDGNSRSSTHRPLSDLDHTKAEKVKGKGKTGRKRTSSD